MQIENPRNEKGIQILSEGSHIRKITKNHYQVNSQSQNKSYDVRKLQDSNIWTCDCSDFMYNLTRKDDKRCKHIISCQLLQKTVQHEKKIEKVERVKICPRCYSSTMVRNGFRIVKNGTRRQRYSCQQCSYKFVLGENGFSKVSSDPKVITEALNLFLSGMSYRNIARHIQSVHDLSISHVAISRWLKK